MQIFYLGKSNREYFATSICHVCAWNWNTNLLSKFFIKTSSLLGEEEEGLVNGAASGMSKPGIPGIVPDIPT